MSTSIPWRGRLRAIWRMCALILLLVWHVPWLVAGSLILGPSVRRGFRIRKSFTRRAMRVLGVRLEVHGDPPKVPALIVSNHRSLLDPFIQLHYVDAHVVSKSEVAGYPLVGSGARETGVIFVTRESKESRIATRAAIYDLLRAHASVLLYPEGTTSNAPSTQDFRIGAFEIAAEAGVPVVPVAIHYRDPRNNWEEGGMLPFFIQKFSHPGIEAVLSFGTPLSSSDPVQLMESSRNWINGEIRKAQQVSSSRKDVQATSS